MYRAQPEFNRICVKRSRDRAYKKHIEALKRVKPSIDTRQPICPPSVGKNFKRYEIEKQRNVRIRNQNIQLVQRLDRIVREEHYHSQAPQRPFTLQGQFQRLEMQRISKENAKLVLAVQNSRPILNRLEWMAHKVDHEYQHHKNAQYRPTLPMSEIIRMEQEVLSARRRPSRHDDIYYDNIQGSQSARPIYTSDSDNRYKPKPPNYPKPDFSFKDPVAEGLIKDDDDGGEQNFKPHPPSEPPGGQDSDYNKNEQILDTKDEAFEIQDPKQQEDNQPNPDMNDNIIEASQSDQQADDQLKLGMRDNIIDALHTRQPEGDQPSLNTENETVDATKKDEIHLGEDADARNTGDGGHEHDKTGQEPVNGNGNVVEADQTIPLTKETSEAGGTPQED